MESKRQIELIYIKKKFCRAIDLTGSEIKTEADEVLKVVVYKKKRTYKAYCMGCNKFMYSTYVLDKNK